jgi:hypothetical protein
MAATGAMARLDNPSHDAIRRSSSISRSTVHLRRTWLDVRSLDDQRAGFAICLQRQRPR